MHRRQILKNIAAVSGTLAFFRPAQLLAAAAQTAAAPKPAAQPPAPIQTIVVTDTIFMLSGAGGNIGLIRGRDESWLIDTGLPERTDDVVKAIAATASTPVRTVINTHWHFDHVGGNERLGKSGAHITAHENTRKRLSVETKIEAYNLTSPAQPAVALPTTTFAEGQTIYADGEELRLFHVPPAHTDTDIAIHFVNSNVIHTGDLFFHKRYPFIDYSTKGWIGGMIAAEEKILSLADAKTKIIPGHGPMATREDLQRTRDMLSKVYSRIDPMVTAGKSADEVVAAKPTADIDAQWTQNPADAERWVRIVYTGIVRHNQQA